LAGLGATHAVDDLGPVRVSKEHAMPHPSSDTPAVKAYWQPGCTSCLRMKEFLAKHGVPFVSVNVLEDKDAFAELAALGVRSVPIVRRGSDWANGQVLRDVARVAGIAWAGAEMLPPDQLAARLVTIQLAAQRLFAQIPDDKLSSLLPHRPRSYAQLAYHTFNIADAFLEHEVQGLPLREGAYGRVPPPGEDGKAEILAYGADVLARFQAWWSGPGQATHFARKANVYYGDVTLHEFLERTTWHSGQHVRQIMMVLDMLGIAPDEPIGQETFAGLPMPDKVWDDERPADSA
jgi:glutaredoxin